MPQAAERQTTASRHAAMIERRDRIVNRIRGLPEGTFTRRSAEIDLEEIEAELRKLDL